MSENANVNPAVAALLPIFVEQVKGANNLALAVKGATQGEAEKVDHILATSEDEAIAAWRAQDEKVRAQLKAAEAKLAENREAIVSRAKSLVSETSTVDVEKTTAEYLSARQDITSMRKVLLGLVGKDEDRLKAILSGAGVEEIVNLRKGSSGGTVGKPKPRLASAKVGDQEYEKPTFTTLAKDLKVDLDDLKSVAFKAGIENGGTESAPIPVGKETTFTIVNKDKATVSVTIVGRSDAKVADEKSVEKTEETTVSE